MKISLYEIKVILYNKDLLKVRENIMVPLGYGKFVHTDKIVSLEPIENDRGPSRYTIVHAEDIKSPFTTSIAENSILANMVKLPREELGTAFELLKKYF